MAPRPPPGVPDPPLFALVAAQPPRDPREIHDPQMLRNSRYPWSLKQRIASRHGHLSNGAMCQLLASLLHDELQVVVLAHLSEQNNTPPLPYDMATTVVSGHKARVFVARQDKPTRLFEIVP